MSTRSCIEAAKGLPVTSIYKPAFSFEDLAAVPQYRFDKILEWSCNENRCHVTAILHFSELVKRVWWKQPGVSVILYPDGVLDEHVSEKKGKGISRTGDTAIEQKCRHHVVPAFSIQVMYSYLLRKAEYIQTNFSWARM
jgi:hypothetical protein